MTSSRSQGATAFPPCSPNPALAIEHMFLEGSQPLFSSLSSYPYVLLLDSILQWLTVPLSSRRPCSSIWTLRVSQHNSVQERTLRSPMLCFWVSRLPILHGRPSSVSPIHSCYTSSRLSPCFSEIKSTQYRYPSIPVHPIGVRHRFELVSVPLTIHTPIPEMVPQLYCLPTQYGSFQLEL